jgi:hypothetical protein
MRNRTTLFISTQTASLLCKFGVFLLLSVFAGSACSHAPSITPPATQQVLTVLLPPALEPLKAGLQSCADDQPGIALFIDEAVANTGNGPDLTISLGEQAPLTAFAASLAIEKIVVVANKEDPPARLTTDDLRGVYGGWITKWDTLGGSQGTVQVWDYAKMDPLHQLFDQAVLKGVSVTSLALLAPTPAAMLEALSSTPGSIGYLPSAWLEVEKVKVISLDDGISAALQAPVLALSAAEPQGALRTFIGCLQTGKGHTVIMQRYQTAAP